MKIKINHNLRRLVTELEIKRRENINHADLARDMRIGYSTVRRYIADEAQRLDIKVLAKIIAYFREEGFDITLNDLFVIEEV